jgi:hypothetical protein
VNIRENNVKREGGVRSVLWIFRMVWGKKSFEEIIINKSKLYVFSYYLDLKKTYHKCS